MTEKRQAALRAATLQAAWAHKRDRSVHYASGFLNGYQVADPSRALALSAATLDEYEAHLAVYDIGLHPVTERQEKLARATALVSWKWLTGMRLYGDTEVLGVWECLDRLAQERQSPSGVRQELTPQRLMEFARELNHVFERWLGWDEEVAPLDHRLMQLLRQGIVERGAPKQRIKHLRSSPTVENFSAHSAEVLASPGCCAKQVRARLAAEPELRPEKPARGSEAGSKPGGPGNHRSPSQALGLAEETVAGSAVAQESAKTTAAFRSPDTAGRSLSRFGTPRDEQEEARRELDREKREEERRRYTAVRRARQAAVAIPGEYRDWVRRVEAALGATGCRGVLPTTAEPKTLDPRRRAPLREGGGVDTAPTEGPHPTGAIPAPAGSEERDFDRDSELVREIAAALWQRMTVFRRYAEKLERKLSMQLLVWGTNPTVPYDRAGVEYARQVGWEIVAHEFGHFQARAVRAATAAEKRLAAGLYALSVGRWGQRAECASLAEDGLPPLGERYWAWERTHPKPGMELPHLDFTDTADQLLRAIELLREAGVDVGKTIPAGYEPD